MYFLLSSRDPFMNSEQLWSWWSSFLHHLQGKGGIGFSKFAVCSLSLFTAVWVLKTFISLVVLFSWGDSSAWRACRDVTGLHTISASLDTNLVNSSKVGNSLPSMRASETWRFQRDTIHSGTFCSSFWFSSQSLNISRPFTWAFSWQADIWTEFFFYKNLWIWTMWSISLKHDEA